MFSIKLHTDTNFFCFNNEIKPRNYILGISSKGISIRNNVEEIFNGKISEISVNGNIYNSLNELKAVLQPILFISNSPFSTNTTLADVVNTIREESDETQELITPISQTIHVPEIRLIAGNYTITQLLALPIASGAASINKISAIADTNVDENSKVAFTVTEDTGIDYTNEITKGGFANNKNELLPLENGTLNVVGEAIVYITYFTNN